MRACVSALGYPVVLALLIAGCSLFPLNDSFDFDVNAYYFKLVEEEGTNIAHPNSFLIDSDLERVPAFDVMKRFGEHVNHPPSHYPSRPAARLCSHSSILL